MWPCQCVLFMGAGSDLINKKKFALQRNYFCQVSFWFLISQFINFFLIHFCSLFRIKESGLFSRYSSKFYTKKPVCSNPQNFQSITIDDAFPALLVVPCGILLAFLVLVVEIFLNFWSHGGLFCLNF